MSEGPYTTPPSSPIAALEDEEREAAKMFPRLERMLLSFAEGFAKAAVIEETLAEERRQRQAWRTDLGDV